MKIFKTLMDVVLAILFLMVMAFMLAVCAGIVGGMWFLIDMIKG